MRVVLYGASELGRDVASMVPALDAAGWGGDVLGFVDDRADLHRASLLGLPVLGGRGWLDDHRDEDLRVLVTIGDPAVRRRVVGELEEGGVRFASVVHPTAVLTPWVEVGEGSVILASSTFTADVRLGRHVVVNPGCTVAHDVHVGDFAYLSPGVDLAGRVVVEEEAYLGTGAVAIPGCRIGARALVGAGAVVVRDVAPDTTVAGVPARPLPKARGTRRPIED